MIYNGFKKRSIATQDVFDFSNDMLVDTATGSWAFGFSGENGNLITFSGHSGFIFDPSTTGLVGSYREGVPFKIDGYIGETIYGYSIDNFQTRIGGEKVGGFTDYFWLDCNNCEVDSNLQIFGKVPDYSIGFLLGYSGTTGLLNGYIYNDESDVNFKLRVFSGEFVNKSSKKWKIKDIYSGDIYGGGAGTANLTVDNYANGTGTSNSLRLYTNFGIYENEIKIEKEPDVEVEEPKIQNPYYTIEYKSSNNIRFNKYYDEYSLAYPGVYPGYNYGRNHIFANFAIEYYKTGTYINIVFEKEYDYFGGPVIDFTGSWLFFSGFAQNFQVEVPENAIPPSDENTFSYSFYVGTGANSKKSGKKLYSFTLLSSSGMTGVVPTENYWGTFYPGTFVPQSEYDNHTVKMTISGGQPNEEPDFILTRVFTRDTLSKIYNTYGSYSFFAKDSFDDVDVIL